MLSDKDQKILNLLIKDGRKSVVEMSEELRIPRATVQERMKKMVDLGVIRRFAAVPDYTKVGQPVTAFVFVSFRNERDTSQSGLAEEISRIPQVSEVTVISGEWDILLKVRAGSVEDIGRLVVDKLRTMRGIERTETCVSFQVIKEGP